MYHSDYDNDDDDATSTETVETSFANPEPLSNKKNTPAIRGVESNYVNVDSLLRPMNDDSLVTHMGVETAKTGADKSSDTIWYEYGCV